MKCSDNFGFSFMSRTVGQVGKGTLLTILKFTSRILKPSKQLPSLI